MTSPLTNMVLEVGPKFHEGRQRTVSENGHFQDPNTDYYVPLSLSHRLVQSAHSSSYPD